MSANTAVIEELHRAIVVQRNMEELEGLIRALEQGEMPLEDSFKAFEKAVGLSKTLQAMLDDGDRRIRVLTEPGEHEMEEERE